MISAHSSELKKLGWKLHRGNTLTAYFVGMLIGEKAKKAKITEVVLDIGLQQSVKGSCVYAAAKGAIDAGLKVPCDKEILPSDDRVHGKHIEAYAKALAADKAAYQRQFATYLKEGVNPSDLSKHIQEMKLKITKGV